MRIGLDSKIKIRILRKVELQEEVMERRFTQAEREFFNDALNTFTRDEILALIERWLSGGVKPPMR